MNEELYIQEKVGKRNPFRVPEGYFDNLTAQVMSNLPEQPKRRAKSVFMRPAFYAVAASVCALLVAGAAWMWSPSAEVSSPTAVQAQVVTQPQQQDASSEYMEEAADYMMLDNHEIYAYLAEN